MADVEIDLESTDTQELIAHAVRAYATADFSNAAAAFGRATQLMAQELGEEHDSLAEIYLQYAKALLEVSREEAEPIGDGVMVDESDDEDEEGAESKEEGEDKEKTESDSKEETSSKEVEEKKGDEKKVEEKKEDEKKVEETKEDEKKVEDKNGDEKKVDETGDKKTAEVVGNGSTKPEEKTSESQPSTGDTTNGDLQLATEGAEGSTEDECTDLQIAWEVLEVAKRIFEKRGNSGVERLAETLILLGEISVESGNYEDGISDIKSGLEMQKELFAETDRKIAETYYKIGNALTMIPDIEEAVEMFLASIRILKSRIELLTKEKDKHADEIKEMALLIPEIEEKIIDTKSIRDEMAMKLMMEMSKTKETEKKPTESSSIEKTVNNISHLIKRKRKDEPTDAPSPKKLSPEMKKTTL